MYGRYNLWGLLSCLPECAGAGFLVFPIFPGISWPETNGRGYLHTFELTNSWVLFTARCCPSEHLGKSRRHHKSHWNVTNIGLEQWAGPVSTGWLLLHCSGAGFTTSSSRTETRLCPATSCGEHSGQLWRPGARVRSQGWSWWWPGCCHCCWCFGCPTWQPQGQ